MRKPMLSILLCTAVSIPALTQAASPMNPGLWEITTQSDSMKNRPQISPEQAARMRQMGINVPEMRNGAMVMKVCYTKELLSRDEMPGQKEHECQTKNMSRSSSVYSADIVCNGPNMKGNGTIKGTHYATSFESNYSFKGTAMGQPANHQRKTSGKWLGANCGSVKPISVGK
ncbi:MAG: hypothetical protein H6R01_562 [Burkholderiaceae bacterium]|nr:hypothetical protein [Burkholderiaceae bacterium]